MEKPGEKRNQGTEGHQKRGGRELEERCEKGVDI